MVKLDNVTEGVLDVINDNKFSQTGAFNLRENGTSICHGDSEHIKIKKKTDKPGIDIYIDGKTDGEAVYIPVVLSKSGMTDLVYNDFYVEDGADVRIVAGCGIHNTRADTTASIPSMWAKMRMSDMRKSTTARETEQVRECSTL